MWKAFDKIQLFIVNFFRGLKFAALEYDVQLQRTVTPKQRLFIWIKIFGAGMIIIFLVIVAIRLISSKFDNPLYIFDFYLNK